MAVKALSFGSRLYAFVVSMLTFLALFEEKRK